MDSFFNINPPKLKSTIEEFKSFSETLTPRMHNDLYKIDRKKHDYEKKSEELLHVNTFLTLLSERYEVKKVEEPPDFITMEDEIHLTIDTRFSRVYVHDIFRRPLTRLK